MINNLSVNTFLKKFSFIIVLLLLSIMFCLEISSAVLESQSIDEGVHLTAGYSYLLNKKIELNPEHPPLVKLLSAIFVYPLSPIFPWTDLSSAEQWDLAKQFFYDLGNNADSLLFWGRLPVMFLSLLLGWLIYAWSKKIAGNSAGLFALALFIFDANILAHSRLITTDIAVSLAFVSSLYSLFKYFERPSNKNLFIFATIFAFSQVVKFSTVLLWPIIIIFGFFSKLTAKQFLKLVVAILLLTPLVIFIVYFGQPSAYLEGITDLVDHEKGGHYSYLLGQYDEIGFWYYFPLAFLVKTPITTLLLIIMSFCLFFFNYTKFRSLNKIPLIYKLLIFFPIFYFIVSMINRINIGIRHLLPIYPFIFIFCGVMIFNPYLKNRIIKIISGCLLVVFIIESLIIYPNYLPYFSLLVGGSANGYKYLLDSNLDWGQDLKKLKLYLDKNNITEPIHLAYFGKSSPRYYNINYLDMSENINNGWIAMSIQHILWPDSRYKWLLKEKPRAIIGGSIYLYYIQK